MRFPIDLHESEIVPTLTRLLAVTGEARWLKKFQTLGQQFKENPFLREWMIERHGVELKLAELLVRQAREGRFPVALQDHLQYELYAFAAGVVRIYDQLSPRGQK